MGIPLRVLLIEDCENDAALVLRELRHGGYEPASHRVQTAVDLAEAFDRQEWDVVISDFTMPQFSGMAALAMVRQRHADLPFILVSGMIGDETAVAAMKAGANDYLLKSALARLAPAVRREIHDVQCRRAAAMELRQAHQELEQRVQQRTAALWDANTKLVTEIADRQRVEQALRESEQRLQLALHASHTGTWDWDIITGRIVWDEATHAIFGVTPESFGGTYDDFRRCIHPEDCTRLEESVARSLAQDITSDDVFRVIWPNGSIRWVAGTGRASYDANGKPIRMTGVSLDVTERKRNEMNLIMRNAIANVLAEASSLETAATHIVRAICENQHWVAGGVWEVDGDAGVLRFVEGWSESAHCIEPFVAASRKSTFEPGVGLPGRVWAEVTPRWVVDVLKDTNFPRTAAAAGVGLRSACAFPICLGATVLGVIEFFSPSIRNPDAELLELMRTLGSQIGQFVQRKRAEAESRRAKQAAEEASRAKTEFLANMSHEIRTPMTAVIGYSDLLLEPGQSPGERLNCVNVIRRNAEHLLTVINDILDISKIEAGKMTVERIACDPRRIIAEVSSLTRVPAAEKKLDFTVGYGGPIPRTITSDPTRLRQILINLVSNAIKFTESGSVRIVVGLIEAASGPLMQFEVLDSGIGMSAEELSRMFQAFEQADGSTTRRFGGTGLGLTISRGLAQLLGGDITAESQPGRGSRFCCTVETGPLDGVAMLDDPHEGAAAEPQPLSQQWRLNGSVLLAEDGMDNQELLSAYLRRAGLNVVIAENGRIACDKALEAAAARNPFDVILMDMQMPVLDGYGAASMLRTKGYGGPIIALTAHAMSEDRRKCLQSGCTDYLTKPISRQALLASVAKYLKPHTQDAEPIHSSADDGIQLRLLPKFINHLPGQVGKLVELLGRQDLEELSKSVHQLKGTGGLYGFMAISEVAARAERAVRRSDPLASIAREVNELISIIRRVEGYDPSKEPPAMNSISSTVA